MIHPERLEHLYKKLSSATLVFTIGDSIEVEAAFKSQSSRGNQRARA
jgi:hypothetical protein